MRTWVLFLVAGFLLLGASLLLGKLFSSHLSKCHPRGSGRLHRAVCRAIAGVNMWIGVAKAGYSVANELPIFGLILFFPLPSRSL